LPGIALHHEIQHFIVMFALIYRSVLLLSAAAETGSQGGFTEFYNKYLNYPGFEAWKFVNLAIFVAFAVYVGKKKLAPSFVAKREEIRAELIKAEEEKQNALKLLTSAEAKLAGLETDKAEIFKRAKLEADAEKKRLAEQTEGDIKRLHEKVSSEVARLQKQVLVRLRLFSVDESLRLAEEKLKAQMDRDKDSRLVKNSISSIGGMS